MNKTLLALWIVVAACAASVQLQPCSAHPIETRDGTPPFLVADVMSSERRLGQSLRVLFFVLVFSGVGGAVWRALWRQHVRKLTALAQEEWNRKHGEHHPKGPINAQDNHGSERADA